MVSEEKKIKVEPASKKEVSPENTSTKGTDASNADGGNQQPPHPGAIIGARARNRFQTPIGITGT
jgi:hypothetical protein